MQSLSLLAAPVTVGDPLVFRLGEPSRFYQRAQTLKSKIADRYDEAISFAMPGRDGLMQDADNSNIYDDTAVIATPEFASRIQAGVIPNFTRWAAFAAGVLIEDEDQKKEVTEALEVVDGYLFEMINNSNFVVEANEFFLDIALGTAAMRIDELASEIPFNSRSCGLRSICFCVGPDGRPDPIFETRKMPIHHIKVHYPDARMPQGFAALDFTAELNVVEVWERDWSEPDAIKYRMSVFLPEMQNAILLQEEHSGAGCLPYIIARWSKSSGEGWGRGPLFNLLPSLRKVNFAEQALLDHTDIALAGIWTVEDNGVLNVDTIRLDPGTLVPTAMGSGGLRNVAPGANFDIAAYMLNESRSTIRKALYTEQLGAPEGTPMSATEVTQRMAELARAIGSPFARILIEFVFPAAMRFLYIAKKRGLIKMPEVDGKELKLTSSSPLAQAQRFDDIEAIDGFLGVLVKHFGSEMLNVVVDGEAAARELAEKFHVPARILRSKEQVNQILTLAAQNQQGQQAPDGGSEPQPDPAGAFG